jgi:hypothetical protein
MFYGYQIKMPAAELRRSYPDHASYVQKVRARADQLVAERWLTPSGRDEVVREAQETQVP